MDRLPKAPCCAEGRRLEGVQMRAMELLDACLRPDPMQAALTMTIGIANLQDTLATQPTLPDAGQTQRVQQHPALPEAIFRCFGVVKEDLLDIVHRHHDRECRRILHLADALIDKMAPRATRPGPACRRWGPPSPPSRAHGSAKP